MKKDENIKSVSTLVDHGLITPEKSLANLNSEFKEYGGLLKQEKQVLHNLANLRRESKQISLRKPSEQKQIMVRQISLRDQMHKLKEVRHQTQRKFRNIKN